MNMRIATIASLALSVAAAHAYAQEPTAPDARYEKARQDKEHGKQPRYVSLDKLIGAEVHLTPSAEARRDAAEEGERPDRPAGEVVDVVIDTGDACVKHAVVSVGGVLGIGEKNVLISSESLQDRNARTEMEVEGEQPVRRTDEDDEPVFALTLTEAELKARPEFDTDRAKEEGLAEAVAKSQVGVETERERRDVHEAGALERENVGTAEAAARPRRWILGSEFDGLSVRNTNDELGSVKRCFVDCNNRTVEFLVISHGGVAGIGDTEYLVPMAACEVIEYDDAPALRITKTEAELESAPEFEETDDASNPVSTAAAQRSREFFGVSDHGKKNDRK